MNKRQKIFNKYITREGIYFCKDSVQDEALLSFLGILHMNSVTMP